MLARAVILAGGLSGAASLSQFPEFSQQYVQRLGGAVDELRLFVEDFDADAASVGLGRDAALEELSKGGALGAARAETMRTTIARFERLEAGLVVLEEKGPFLRAYHAVQFNDPEIAKAAWEDFKPAMPLTFEGAVFSGVGFVGAGLGLSLIFAVFRRLFRRRKPAHGAA